MADGPQARTRGLAAFWNALAEYLTAEWIARSQEMRGFSSQVVQTRLKARQTD